MSFHTLKLMEEKMKGENKEISLFPKLRPFKNKKSVHDKKKFEIPSDAKEIIVKSSEGSEINYTGYDLLLQKVEETETFMSFLLEDGMIKLKLNSLPYKNILVTCKVKSSKENVTFSTNLSENPLYKLSFTSEKDVGKIYNVFYLYQTPEGSWFCIPLKEHQQRIVVKVVEGKDLPNLDVGAHNYSDPFVVLTLGNVTQKTKVIDDNLNPNWNETFAFDVLDLSVPLQFSCFDKDVFVDDLIGASSLDLNTLYNGYNDIWVSLPKGKLHLEIETEGFGIRSVEKLYLDFVEQYQTLSIIVGKAHELEVVDDYVCYISLGPQAKRTPVVKGESNPTFNQEVSFNIVDSLVTEIKLEIWDATKTKFYGKTVLPISKILFKKKFTAKLKDKSSETKGTIEFIIEKNKEVKESEKKIFGVSLQDVMKRDHEVENIPLQIKYLIDFLLKHGPNHEGIFRISGSNDFVNEWVKKMDLGGLLLLNIKKDVESLTHNVSSIFKKYIRDLPIPLLTYENYDQFIQLLKIENDEEEEKKFEELLTKIPRENYQLLSELMNLCIQVEAKKDSNKMTCENLAVVFGMGILKHTNELKTTNDIGAIQKAFITIFKIFKKKSMTK